MIKLKSYAKINLTLEILGKRPDGFHDISSVMQMISLCDELTFTEDAQVNLSCDDSQFDIGNNSIIKTASLLKERTGYRGGAAIKLLKHIPLSSGLGGHSSNAAVTLLALNRLWELKQSGSELHELAAGLGSDMPFFLNGPTALAGGRGEIIYPLGIPAVVSVIVLKPPFTVAEKTRMMYSRINSRHFTDGSISRQQKNRIETGHEIELDLCYNVFEIVAFEVFAGLDGYRQELYRAGANKAYLAGAGPSLFTLEKDRERAQRIFLKLKDRKHEAYLAHTVTDL